MKKIFIFFIFYPLIVHDFIHSMYKKIDCSTKPCLTSAQKLLSTLTFNGEESVLDIECGNGGTTALIAKNLHDGFVYGIAASESAIKLARIKHKDNDTLSFMHMRAEEILFNNEYNIVTAFSCFHWFRNQYELLVQINQSLKPDGIFLATIEFHDDNYNDIITSLLKTCCIEKWKKHCHPEIFNQNYKVYLAAHCMAHNHESITVMLNKSGFRTINLEYIEEKIIFSNKSKFIKQVTNWLDHLSLFSSIHETEKLNFIMDAVDYYTNNYKSVHDDKSIEYLNRQLLVHAMKDVKNN